MDYGLYQAEVVNVASKDNRLGVRVLPKMQGIDASLCPLWSWFFIDEMHICNLGDIVWVVCDNEFSQGYILGVSNYSTYREESFVDYSIKESLKERASKTLTDIEASVFDYADLKVTFWNDTSIHFIEKSTGGSIIAYKSGSLYVMRSNEFILKIGSSLLKIDSKGINLSAPTVKAQGDVFLGNNPEGSVMVTSGVSSAGAIASSSVRA